MVRKENVKVFCTYEHNFCFSERPSVGSDYDIEINTSMKEEKRILANSMDRMYDQECNVSLDFEVCLNLVLMCTGNPSVQVYHEKFLAIGTFQN